jgi:hypothetical protein
MVIKNATRKFLLTILWSILSWAAVAQSTRLTPGFDRAEYVEMSKISRQHFDLEPTQIPPPQYFKSVYRSAVVGLDNRWELWTNNKGIATICVRGTTANPVGWLENFYAAMVPASGDLKLTNTFTFKYHLADHPKAGVHIGWLVGMAFLARDIVPKIDSCHKAGIRDFFITGHSQGGALSYLLTSHLYNLQKLGILAKDIRFKTYASAAPKVGNLFYGYEYENAVAGGWGYNVINGADWVPELPFTVQTLGDFNETNPFKNVDAIFKKQTLLKRIALKHAYKQLKNPPEKAQRNYQKYLGDYASKIIRKSLPDFQPPVYFPSSNFVRIGPTITLIPDEAYYKHFPNSDEKIFIHHFFEPYLYLIDKNFP